MTKKILTGCGGTTVSVTEGVRSCTIVLDTVHKLLDDADTIIIDEAVCFSCSEPPINDMCKLEYELAVLKLKHPNNCTWECD